MSLVAQDSISLSPLFISTGADLDDVSTMPGDIVGHGFVTNHSDETKTFFWKRTIEEVPEGWTTAVCDINLCYFHTVDSMQFELAAGMQGIVDVHAYPGGSPGADLDLVNPGTGKVVISITEVGNDENTASAEWEFILDGTPVGVDELEAQQIGIFPNPATNYFNISNSNELSQIQVFNILGKKMFETNVTEGKRFDITDLSKGIYLVRMIDDENAVVKTIKLKKS